jgi:hypothetical protein
MYTLSHWTSVLKLRIPLEEGRQRPMLLKMPLKPLLGFEWFASTTIFKRIIICFTTVIILYSRPLSIIVYIWVVVVTIWIVVICFRVRLVYFQLSGQISFKSLKKVSSVPVGNWILTWYSLRWVWNTSLVGKKAEQVHCSCILFDMLRAIDYG